MTLRQGRGHETYDVLDARGRVLGSVWNFGSFGWAAMLASEGTTRWLDFAPTADAAARIVTETRA